MYRRLLARLALSALLLSLALPALARGPHQPGPCPDEAIRALLVEQLGLSATDLSLVLAGLEGNAAGPLLMQFAYGDDPYDDECEIGRQIVASAESADRPLAATLGGGFLTIQIDGTLYFLRASDLAPTGEVPLNEGRPGGSALLAAARYLVEAKGANPDAERFEEDIRSITDAVTIYGNDTNAVPESLDDLQAETGPEGYCGPYLVGAVLNPFTGERYQLADGEIIDEMPEGAMDPGLPPDLADLLLTDPAAGAEELKSRMQFDEQEAAIFDLVSSRPESLGLLLIGLFARADSEEDVSTAQLARLAQLAGDGETVLCSDKTSAYVIDGAFVRKLDPVTRQVTASTQYRPRANERLLTSVEQLTPLFEIVSQNAHQTACLSNLRQLSVASLSYAQDYDEILPLADWAETTQPYIGSLAVLNCPDAPDVSPGYAMNEALVGLNVGDIEQPSNTVLFFDSDLGGPSPLGGPENIAFRHHGGANVAFADGHARWISEEDAGTLVWDPTRVASPGVKGPAAPPHEAEGSTEPAKLPAPPVIDNRGEPDKL
jgi:prepilin-type processing-associated H-X9-DG protein